MDDAALAAALATPVVVARAAPEHKIRIVGLLQAQGEVVAMTGDGVNDAPALKKADVGVAMGLRGTDVARDASDIVLTDDHFASIIAGVEEGRRQFANVEKFVRYLLTSNAGEVLAVGLNIVLGGPLILLPVQILWMNLVTDGATALALGAEPVEADAMRRPPRDPSAPILGRRWMGLILLMGAYLAAAALFLFHGALQAGGPDALVRAQTVAFTALVVMQKVNVFNFRSLHLPVTSLGLFSNPWLLLAVAGSLGLQVAAVYVPVLQTALGTVGLDLAAWGWIALASVPVIVVPEVVKAIARRRER
jgi:Ca2+-transporting ATPase